MFGFFKPKTAEVLSHWYAPVPNFNTATDDFYLSIEKDLKDRQVPALQISRVEFSEGGILSANRTYLRMTRERLVFDICAAPFGTSYFFSCRFAELPAVIKIWQLVILVGGVVLFFAIFWKLFGLWLGTIAIIAALFLLTYLLRNAVALGLKDLDATILSSPFGPIYEQFFRKETYYRVDTRLMYLDTVNEIVKAKVEEVTSAKGIKLVRFNEYSPILRDLYKPTTVQPKSPPPAT